jgi:hypothetical protein
VQVDEVYGCKVASATTTANATMDWTVCCALRGSAARPTEEIVTSKGQAGPFRDQQKTENKVVPGRLADSVFTMARHEPKTSFAGNQMSACAMTASGDSGLYLHAVDGGVCA